MRDRATVRILCDQRMIPVANRLFRSIGGKTTQVFSWHRTLALGRGPLDIDTSPGSGNTCDDKGYCCRIDQVGTGNKDARGSNHSGVGESHLVRSAVSRRTEAQRKGSE